MKRLSETVLIISICILGLAACGSPPQPEAGSDEQEEAPSPAVTAETGSEGSRPAVTSVHAWDCEDDTYVVTEFRNATDTVFVFLPGTSIELGHVPSASGAKYSDGETTLWNKGEELMVDQGEGDVQCTRNARASNIETAKLAGFDVWAIGNEPGWTLRLGSVGIVWETDYGETLRRAAAVEPETDEEARASVYRTEVDGEALVITVSGEGCSDDMSGEEFPIRVVIEFQGRTYRGCGQGLH